VVIETILRILKDFKVLVYLKLKVVRHGGTTDANENYEIKKLKVTVRLKQAKDLEV
jgi:hypothetical protein